MGNTYLTVRTHPRSVTWSPTRDSPPSEPCGVVGVSGLGFRARSGGARRKAAVRSGSRASRPIDRVGKRG